MGKKIITFGDNESEERKFHHSKTKFFKKMVIFITY